jgi:hypothetical protein
MKETPRYVTFFNIFILSLTKKAQGPRCHLLQLKGDPSQRGLAAGRPGTFFVTDNPVS